MLTEILNILVFILVFGVLPALVLWGAHHTDESWIIMDDLSYTRTFPYLSLVFVIMVELTLITLLAWG